jgi:arylformamidase
LWRFPDFQRSFRALTGSAAEWLVERGLKLIGMDYLSVDPYDAQPKLAHLALLGAGVVVLEGLDLRGVPVGNYELTCLPIRLVGADAAPARVVLSGPMPAPVAVRGGAS